MFRWIFVSLLLSACGVAAVWLLVPHIRSEERSSGTDTYSAAPRVQRAEVRPEGEAKQAPARPVAVAMASGSGGHPQVVVYRNDSPQEWTDPVIIPDGRLVAIEKQVVPAEREGAIKFIGTEVLDREDVPKERQLPEAKIGILATPVGPDEKPREGERFFQAPDGVTYRPVHETDTLTPDKLRLFQEMRKVRKLEVGDHVKRGQLLALIDPSKQFDEVASKVAKIDATEAERRAAEKQEREYLRRYNIQEETNRKTPGAIPRDTMMETLIAYEKHKSEKEVKLKETVIAQRALNAALTELKLYEVRAAIDGDIKVIHKNLGEAVKQHDSLLEIQNPARLRVDARLELQETRQLKVGMKAIVEASRPEAPRQVISGHLGAVNCVAVSKGKRPVIVSGSDDETLRGWDSLTGEKLWRVYGQRSAVRSVACSPPASRYNFACFGCADGSIHILDLDHPEQKPREMSERHRGPVLGIAFSPDGESIATCGDDRSICLWKTESGGLLHRLVNAHSNSVTSVRFASAQRMVSAGKDNRLAVWDVEAGKTPHLAGSRFPGRSGEVLTLDVSPDGKTVLFDQGKELRLLTLDDKQIAGILQNPSEGMNFSTMALFSPDGKTILTNGAAPGKLQLWRTPVTQKRGSELRRFIWNTPKGIATCGAFAPEDGSFVVTGTQDDKVLVWTMPSQEEIDSRLEATLTLVEYNLDTPSRHVRVWAELDNPGWLIPGMQATMVVQPPRK